MKLLSSPWKNEFINIISKTKSELFISTPFINIEGVKVLSRSVNKDIESIDLSLITSLTPRNIINGITEPKALLELYKHFNQVRISSLGKLHAKVYLIDNEIGIITSANLTTGGLVNNFEYGILIDDKETVLNIKEDMQKYYSFGNILDIDLLEKISTESSKLEVVKEKTNNLIKNTNLAKLLKKGTEFLNFELLKNRVKEGKTINAIFSDTIIYLLDKKGPLSTEEINPLIQAIHPDICDDSIDRIINGQHFGKKWKHLVRDAQQALKKKGVIDNTGRRYHQSWFLTS